MGNEWGYHVRPYTPTLSLGVDLHYIAPSRLSALPS